MALVSDGIATPRKAELAKDQVETKLMTSVFAFWESPTRVSRWQGMTRAKLHRLNRLLGAPYCPAALSWILRVEF